MKTKFFILLMILLSCEEIPDPGGSGSCSGVYDLEPASSEDDIILRHASEEEIQIEFMHEDICILKYHITRLSSDGQTYDITYNISDDDSGSIFISDDINIMHDKTYFYTISGEDTYGNQSSTLSGNITPEFLAEISNFSVMYNDENERIDLSWEFENVLGSYNFEIDWKDGDDDEYEHLDTIDGTSTTYQHNPASIEPNNYYSYRLRATTSINNSDWSISNNYTGTGQNYAPIMEEISNQTMDEDSELTIQLMATDQNFDILSYEADCENDNIMMDINDDILTISPIENFSGQEIISIYVNDGYEGNDTTSFELLINSVNDNPELTQLFESYFKDEDFDDIIIDLNSHFNDVDGDSLSYTYTTIPNNIFNTQFDDELGILTLISYQDIFGGPVLVTVIADDNPNNRTAVKKSFNNVKNRSSASGTFNVSVSPVNDAPVMMSISNQIMDEDTVLSIQLFANDVDGDYLTYSATCPLDINCGINGNILTLRPASNWSGTVEDIEVKANDGEFDSNPVSFDLVVNGEINSPPIMEEISNQIMDEDTVLSIQLFANDVDGDYLTYNTTCSNEIECETNGNILTLRPASNWSGTVEDIEVKANDGEFDSNIVSFDLVVNEVNDDPDAVVMPNLIFPEDFNPHLIDLSDYFSDIENGTNLSYIVSVDNLGIINVSILEDILTISSVADQNGGPITVTVIANDVIGRNTVESSFNVNVTPVNDAPPVLTFIDTQNINEEEPLTLILNAFDYDGDNLTYTAICDDRTDCSIAGSVLTVNPNIDYYGLQNISISVDDGYDQSSDSQVFSLNVVPINNDDPILEFISNGETDEEAFFLTVLEISDVDENPEFFVEASGNNVDITITEIDNFTYELKAMPDENYNGTSNIEVIVRDNEYNTYGTQDSQDFNLEVNYVADSPTIATINSQEVDEDESLTVVLDIQDPDTVYGDNLTVECVPEDFDINCNVIETSSFSYSLEIIGEPDYFVDGIDVRVTVTDSDLVNEDEEGTLLPNEVETIFNLDIISVNDIPVLNSSDFDSAENITEDGTGQYNFEVSDVDLILDENEGINVEIMAYYFTVSYDEFEEPIINIGEDADIWEYDANILTVTPDFNYNSDSDNDGTYDEFIQLEVKVTDAYGEFASKESIITIDSVNDIPEITIDDVIGIEDTGGIEGEDGAVNQVFFTVNDVEDDNNSFTDSDFIIVYNTVVESVSAISPTEISGEYTFDLTSIDNYFGETNLYITVTDSNEDDSITEEFTWAVASVQDGLPLLEAFDISDFDEDNELDVLISASDLFDIYEGYQGDILFSASSSNENILVEFQSDNSIDTLTHSNTLTISAIENWNGSADITVKVTDADNGFITSEVTPFLILPVNDSPEININSLEVIVDPEDGVFEQNYLLSDYASDVEEDLLYYTFEDDQLQYSGINLSLVGDINIGYSLQLEVNPDEAFVSLDSHVFPISITVFDCDPNQEDNQDGDPGRECGSSEHQFSLKIDKQALGCMDITSCSYNAGANVDDGSCLYSDCNGDCDGSAILNVCNECIYGNTGINEDIGDNGPYGTDCNGDCDGLAILNECNECIYGNTGIDEDIGDNGPYGTDACGNCGGDCFVSFTYPTAWVDCGEDPDNAIISGCDGVCGSGLELDCAGDCEGSAVLDECGECVDPDDACILGCMDDTNCNYDELATDNDPSQCLTEDCAGLCGGSTIEDECGVCGGTGPEENFDCDGNCVVDIDCAGVCGGDSVVDECGVCDGDGIADGACDCDGNVEDCAGKCGGSAMEDECGECNGDGASYKCSDGSIVCGPEDCKK